MLKPIQKIKEGEYKMKRTTLFAMVFALALSLLVALPAAAKHAHSFRGHWVGIDGDGSNLTLSFDEQNHSGGVVFNITGADDSAFCYTGTCTRAKMEGIGIFDGGTIINASVVWWAPPTGENAALVNGTYTYDPANDSVTDIDGIVYYRAR
jgi:hypothetical protein